MKQRRADMKLTDDPHNMPEYYAIAFSCEHGNDPAASVKQRTVSWPAERLLDSQEEQLITPWYLEVHLRWHHRPPLDTTAGLSSPLHTLRCILKFPINILQHFLFTLCFPRLWSFLEFY